MTARELLKRTPFRLAATFATLFSVTAVLLFVALYAALRAELAGEIVERVDETLDALSAVDRNKGFDDLTSVVTSESDSVRDADTIFLLIDKAGQYRAGNVRDIAVSPGLLRLPRDTLALTPDRGDPDDVFLAKWQPMSDGSLLVGSSDREIRRIEGMLGTGLAWGLCITSVLAAAAGAVLARRADLRLRAITGTLDAAAQGNLGARIPLSRSNDDIDHIGRQINQTVAKLQTLVENVNQSSSDIAHDLKKPMSRLQHTLERARVAANNPTQVRSAIDESLAELESIVETFEALLRITQIEAGARKSRFREIDLAEVLSEVGEVYQPVAEDSGLQLNVTPTLTHAPVWGDRELLVQMFANLIENSIRHCPGGTQIGMSLEEHPEGYSATVADTGPGIPEAERKKVFRRLYRLEAARSTPGNGLGLALVSAIAELHDAKVALGDNGPGLRVVVDFPISTHRATYQSV